MRLVTDAKNRSSGNNEGADAECSPVRWMIEVSNNGQEIQLRMQQSTTRKTLSSPF